MEALAFALVIACAKRMSVSNRLLCLPLFSRLKPLMINSGMLSCTCSAAAAATAAATAACCCSPTLIPCCCCWGAEAATAAACMRSPPAAAVLSRPRSVEVTAVPPPNDAKSPMSAGLRLLAAPAPATLLIPCSSALPESLLAVAAVLPLLPLLLLSPPSFFFSLDLLSVFSGVAAATAVVPTEIIHEPSADTGAVTVDTTPVTAPVAAENSDAVEEELEDDDCCC